MIQDLHDLAHVFLGCFSVDWICSTYADPAQPLTTTGEDLDQMIYL